MNIWKITEMVHFKSEFYGAFYLNKNGLFKKPRIMKKNLNGQVLKCASR